jgi:hypothetical protein
MINFGSAFGDGSGYGYGYGSGSGYGYGSDYGYGYGFGSGSGYGYGYGSGSGYGYGYGYGCKKTYISPKNAWEVFHFIEKNKKGEYKTSFNNKIVKIGDILYEEKINLCSYGLHASLSLKDAAIHAESGMVATKCLVWGEIIVGQDKLVAQYRKIIEEIK